MKTYTYCSFSKAPSKITYLRNLYCAVRPGKDVPTWGLYTGSQLPIHSFGSISLCAPRSGWPMLPPICRRTCNHGNGSTQVPSANRTPFCILLPSGKILLYYIVSRLKIISRWHISRSNLVDPSLTAPLKIILDTYYSWYRNFPTGR